MKIVFLSGLYPPHTKGGGEISTHLIARGLAEAGHEVTVVTQNTEHGTQYAERRTKNTEHRTQNTERPRIIKMDLPFTAKPLLERRWARRMARSLLPEIQKLGRFDVIHAHDYKMILILSEMRPAFAKGYGASSPLLVATARDYAQISGTTNYVLADGSKPRSWIEDAFKNQRIREASPLRKPFRLWQYLWNTPYRRRAFRNIPNQIFISRAQRELIDEVQDLSGIKTDVIYNPVRDEYLHALVAEGGAGQVLYVGRVEDYKGVGLLLEAWREVIKAQPGARLKIVGEGAQRENYELRISPPAGGEELSSSVEFVGKVQYEKLRGVYDEAQIVVAPHLWVEPFGRTVAEAMARGKIVVAANTGGPAEMITDGETGFLFERGSVEGLAAKLVQALQLSPERQKRIGLRARVWVKENLNCKGIAAAHENLYKA